MAKMESYWMGPAPKVCDTCDTPIGKVFYDMRTTSGVWGNLCPTCAVLGPGVGKTGPGFGQKYEKVAAIDRYLKTEG